MRRKEEQLNSQCLQKIVKGGGGGSIMVFAAFSLNGPDPIIRIAKTMNGQS